MARVLHKTADPVDYRESVNTPDYSTDTWFINPDVSAVAGVDPKYWARPLTDPVTAMDQASKDAVDAARLSLLKDAIADEFDDPGSVMRALGEVLIDELNMHAARVNAILDSIDAGNNLSTIKSAIALINDVPTRTLADIKTSVRNKL